MDYIGIDLGTSAVKLLLMQGDGRILKVVSREYPIHFPKPGWSQQDPQDWYRETVEGLKGRISPRWQASVLGGRCMALWLWMKEGR